MEETRIQLAEARSELDRQVYLAVADHFLCIRIWQPMAALQANTVRRDLYQIIGEHLRRLG